MPQVTDSMFKTVIIGAVFLTLWAIFNALFIGSVINTQGLSLSEILSQSWAVFMQPELLIFNALFGIIGLVISLIVVRELLPA
jgi:hypothetical protein